MPKYTSAEILTDGKGNPMPQYLDVTDTSASPEGTFKPLGEKSKVELTGSNVEEVITTTLAITDTNSYDFDIDLSECKGAMLEVISNINQPINFDVRNNGLAIYNVGGSLATYQLPVVNNGQYMSRWISEAELKPLGYTYAKTNTLRLRCSVAPTSGYITLKLYKRKV